MSLADRLLRIEEENVDRRSFLKFSAFASASVLLSGCDAARDRIETREQHWCGNVSASSAASFTKDTTVGEVKADSAFGDFGRLLFPVDRSVPDSMTLAGLSTSNVYVWYNYIQTNDTVDILNTLRSQAESGQEIFFPIYSDAEMAADSTKRDTGLFFFRGKTNARFAICNAGGGFMYVGAMHDSFPHALTLSRMGYNAFALIYRVDSPYDDLAQAISYIEDHADDLGVAKEGYSLWGGSAGARMAATLGNAAVLAWYRGKGMPQAAAVITQYTGYSSVSRTDAPAYACVGTSDGIANWRTMRDRLQTLKGYGIPTEFHRYQGLPHGFGLGKGTVAEGWINDAVKFWEAQT